MADSAPVVYLLHGDDEFAIAQFISDLEDKLGDPAMAAMNITRLDGRSYDTDELLSVAGTMPFLTRRRIVELTHPLARLNSPTAREKFKAQLEQIPPTTALILVEYRQLTDEKARRKGALHWLEKWALQAGSRVLVRVFLLPKGPAMARWIQDRARSAGGQLTPKAAELLATLVGDDPRLADQEIQKLLAYVNYHRPVEPEDVEELTADAGQTNIFEMVDALGNRDGRRAVGMLHRLLEQQDYFSIFGMIVRQFRLLLLACEVIDRGGHAADIARELKIHPFVAEKINAQARRLSRPVLENLFRRLLDLDEAVKTSQVDGDLGLDTLVADFTSQPG